uniref:WW domain-containing protein n=1 Tax=Leishmania guyanensis TaxID=5670 RepID=A0A1E1J1P9_LEIGU|nr:hypothetical protein, conserved [Leishmania guyanensis]
MLPPTAFLKEQPLHNSPANGSSLHTEIKSSAATAVATSSTNAASGGATKDSPPELVNTSSIGCSSGGPLPSTGCVRWCMNVALQSFSGEPWAVTLQPTAEDDAVLNRSFQGSFADPTITPPSLTSAAANSTCQQLLQKQGLPNGTAHGGGSGSASPAHSFMGTHMKPFTLRSGLRLVAIDYSNPQPQYPGGPVVDATAFGYDPLSEDSTALHQCVSAVNSPPVTYGVDDLLGRITNVEFIAEQGSPEETAAGVPIHYRLASSLEPMLNATLNPAITAVVDHCVSSIVLVYGTTQEMKQMGLIGTPEKCGLLPHGIRTFMERLLERKEHQLSKAASSNSSPKSTNDRAAATSDSHSANVSSSHPPHAAGTVPPTSDGAEDTVSGSDRTEGVSRRSATPQSHSFVFPSIGSRYHRFVRMEATFIAFDSTSVVDLLDLSNKHVELVLKLAPPPTPSAFEEKTGDVNSATNSSATTDSFVLNAQAMPAENANDALSALDVGLENLTRALELALLQSESGSSLLFSLTAFTDTCRCATMHVLCLAEDPAAQTWLVSTVQARSQAISLGEEQSWASIQNTPMPPPLHHHAATMLVPALCFGNIFASVLICVYNSITALSRLNRDLTFAVAGYCMRTIPRVTLASSRCGLKKLPPSWEEYFTSDGRRYFIDTTTQTTTWDDPRFTYTHRSSRSSDSAGNNLGRGSTGSSSGRSSRGSNYHNRPSRIGLGSGDKDFLMCRLQQEMHGGSASAMDSSGTTPEPAKGAGQPPTLGAPASDEGPIEISIVVVDTMCRPRVLMSSHDPQFALQYREQEEMLRAKRRELEEATEELRRMAESKAKAAAVLAETGRAAQETGQAIVPVTEKSSEVAQPAADRAAPKEATDVAHSPSTPRTRVIGLNDVDDEEVSALCRSNSVNIDHFMFEDESGKSGKDDEPGGTERISAPAIASRQASGIIAFASDADGGDGAAKQQSCNYSNSEARFYARVLQDQAVDAAEMNVPSTVSSRVASVTASSVIRSAAAPENSRSIATAGSDERSTSGCSDAPTEVQDLESLVDEFTDFYRRAFELQKRVIELEVELKRRKSTERSPSPSSLPAATTTSDVGVPELVRDMLKEVEVSPSAEVRAALTPVLTSAASTSSAAATASVVLQAFHEALRLAAQTTHA